MTTIEAARLAGMDADWLLHRSELHDDCWFWQRSYSHNGYPTVYVPAAKRGITARRIAAEIQYGYESKAHVIPTCGHIECVNPAHMRYASAKEIGAIAAARGAFGTRSRREAISRGMLANSTIPPEARRQILAAEYGQLKSVCETWDVAYSTGKAIRSRQVADRRVFNPWQGMGAR